MTYGKTLSPMIRVHPDTRKKLNAISEQQRRNIAQTIDVLADEYIERSGMKVPGLRQRQRNSAAMAG